jgi:hypothetical protein
MAASVFGRFGDQNRAHGLTEDVSEGRGTNRALHFSCIPFAGVFKIARWPGPYLNVGVTLGYPFSA